MAAFTITKKFRFEAAHRLPNYPGKCARIHGHSFNIEVELARRDGGVSISTHTGRENMVLDFALLKDFGKQLDTEFDHKIILSTKDPLKDVLVDAGYSGDIALMAGPPTAESLARLIFVMLERFLDKEDFEHVVVVAVTVHETCTGRATYQRIPGSKGGGVVLWR